MTMSSTCPPTRSSATPMHRRCGPRWTRRSASPFHAPDAFARGRGPRRSLRRAAAAAETDGSEAQRGARGDPAAHTPQRPRAERCDRRSCHRSQLSSGVVRHVVGLNFIFARTRIAACCGCRACSLGSVVPCAHGRMLTSQAQLSARISRRKHTPTAKAAVAACAVDCVSGNGPRTSVA
jgi:hypothetical protein